MIKSRPRPYTQQIQTQMSAKSKLLSQAHAMTQIGLIETARPLWAAAAEHEEQIAPLLDALGREEEAALHRVSAASCYQKSGNPSRAANLFQAALAGPLNAERRAEIEQMLSRCLAELEP